MFEAGEDVFYRRPVQVGFTSLSLWEIVTITRTTKTLIFVDEMRFKRKGDNLYEINDETKQRAELDNRILRHKQLCGEFWIYKWDKVSLEKLLQIEAILKIEGEK